MNINEISRHYIKSFGDIHERHNFIKESAVNVSSRIDTSVFLIGSSISVLKPYFDKGVCYDKRYIIQPAIRTQQLSDMEHNVITSSCYGSFFFAMGNLAPYENLYEIFEIAVEFFKNILQGDTRRIMFRIYSQDNDLLACCRRYEERCLTEVDSKPEAYYRHHYGMNDIGIFGRNCNIAIAAAGGTEYKDVANIIVIEKNGIPFAVECAIGLSTLICHTYSMKHTMLGNIIADVLPMKDLKDYRLGDCLSVIACLETEGVVPSSSHMQGRLLKRYKRVLSSLCADSNIDEKQINILLLQLKYQYTNLLKML